MKTMAPSETALAAEAAAFAPPAPQQMLPAAGFDEFLARATTGPSAERDRSIDSNTRSDDDAPPVRAEPPRAADDAARTQADAASRASSDSAAQSTGDQHATAASEQSSSAEESAAHADNTAPTAHAADDSSRKAASTDATAAAGAAAKESRTTAEPTLDLEHIGDVKVLSSSNAPEAAGKNGAGAPVIPPVTNAAGKTSGTTKPQTPTTAKTALVSGGAAVASGNGNAAGKAGTGTASRDGRQGASASSPNAGNATTTAAHTTTAGDAKTAADRQDTAGIDAAHSSNIAAASEHATGTNPIAVTPAAATTIRSNALTAQRPTLAVGSAGPQATTAATVTGAEEVTAARPVPVAEQVLDAVLPMHNRADGDYHVKLELRPAELGRVELTVELHDGVLSVHMHADNAAARDVLQHQLARLRDMLQERGVRTGSLDVGDHSDRAATRNPQDAGDTASRTSGTARNEPAPATAVAVAQPAVAAPSLTPSTEGRLDLHV